MSEIRYRSESIRIKVTVKVNDVAVDLDDYSGIVFILYYQTNIQIDKYSRDVVTGYDSDNFKVIDAANGRFDILIQPSVTLPANLDEVRGEVLVQKTDPDWDSDTWRRIISGIELFKFKDSMSKNVGVV